MKPILSPSTLTAIATDLRECRYTAKERDPLDCPTCPGEHLISFAADKAWGDHDAYILSAIRRMTLPEIIIASSGYLDGELTK